MSPSWETCTTPPTHLHPLLPHISETYLAWDFSIDTYKKKDVELPVALVKILVPLYSSLFYYLCLQQTSQEWMDAIKSLMKKSHVVSLTNITFYVFQAGITYLTSYFFQLFFLPTYSEKNLIFELSELTLFIIWMFMSFIF